MQISNIPSKYTYAFAASAGGTYSRTIPATTLDANAASQLLGFPPNTFVPTDTGGAAPDGRDFNGILNQITQWQIWQQAGAPVPYDSTFQTNIGGYPRNCVILSGTTPGRFYMSTTDNNVTNPDTGGAGWTAWTFGSGGGGGVTSITAGLGLSGGTITTSGTIALLQASTSQLGGVKVDGTSIVISAGGVISATTGGTGSVNSVGLSMPSIFSVSGSPVTTTGTLAASLIAQSANTVFAGPAGGSGTPAFRALVSADLPAATNSQRGAVQTDGVTTIMTGSVISAAVGITSVDVSGGATGLTFSGGPVTSSGVITMAGTLGIGFGGTSATTAAGARTNLGLGTIATQAASNVAITGGSVTGLTTFSMTGTASVTGAVIATNEVRSNAESTCGGGGRGMRAGSGSALQLFSQDGGTANLTISGMTCVAFTPTSDERLKYEILPTAGMGLSTIGALAGARYRLASNGQRGSGVIAQQVRDVLPHLVHEDENGYLAVNYDGLWAYAIEAIKELHACIAKH